MTSNDCDREIQKIVKRPAAGDHLQEEMSEFGGKIYSSKFF